MNSIAILGTSISSKNQGVQALSASLVGICHQFSNDIHITLMVGNHTPDCLTYKVGSGNQVSVNIINYRLSPHSKTNEHFVWIIIMCIIYKYSNIKSIRSLVSNITPWITAMENADLVADIRGGDSFSDIYGFRRYALGFLVAWTAILVKGSLIQLPQTYGPFSNSVTEMMAKYIFKKSSIILARDKRSQRIASELVGNIKKVMLVPDVAFCLEPSTEKDVSCDKNYVYRLDDIVSTGMIGLNINGLVYNGGYNRNNMFNLVMDYRKYIVNLLIYLLRNQSNDIMLVPHTYGNNNDIESDTEASYGIRDLLPPELYKRVFVVADKFKTNELKSLIGECDFFIGSRLHSCIAALSQGVPCVGVAYSDKFQGVFETVGMEKWVIDGRILDENTALENTVVLYRDRNLVRHTLAKGVGEARSRIRNTFNQILTQRRHC